MQPRKNTDAVPGVRIRVYSKNKEKIQRKQGGTNINLPKSSVLQDLRDERRENNSVGRGNVRTTPGVARKKEKLIKDARESRRAAGMTGEALMTLPAPGTVRGKTGEQVSAGGNKGTPPLPGEKYNSPEERRSRKGSLGRSNTIPERRGI